jgi:hypothetical protein
MLGHENRWAWTACWTAHDPAGARSGHDHAAVSFLLRAEPRRPTLDDMGSIALWVFAVFLPSLAAGAVLFAVRGWRRADELARRLRADRAPAEPVDHEARLRRLRAELEALENQPGGTAKRHRVVAVRGAYLDCLTSACQQFGVSPPAGGDRARQAEIYRVEAALRAHGLDVREPAVR